MKRQINPLVSVIVAFFNEEQFLGEAVESVIKQTYTNWELILVDDGSSDGSTVLAQQYAAASNGKIIYAEHEDHSNKGLSASRNKGISLAKGTFLAFLDADDVWLPKKLKKQVAIMQEKPEVAMICEASLYWYTWKFDKSHDTVIRVGNDQDKVFYPPELLDILYPLSSGNAPVPSGILIRKEIAEKHGCFEAHFTGKYQLYEDQGFLHKIYLNEPVFISSDCNNKYRQRTGSLVQSIKSEGGYNSVRKYFLDWLQQYMQANGFINEKTSFLLTRAIRIYEQIDNPFITIVTIFRNHDQYLKDTIESAINQTHTRWEYILINNGSTDSSLAIAEDYASKNKKIKVIQYEDKGKGLMACRNLGIESASGEYLAFLDVNSIWLPGRLQDQVEQVKQYPEAGVWFEMNEQLPVPTNHDLKDESNLPETFSNTLVLPPALFYKMQPYGIAEPPRISNALLDLWLVNSVKNFEESFSGAKSYYGYSAFLVKAFLNFPVYFSGSCNTIYRQLPTEQAISESDKGDYHSGRSHFLKWTKQYLEHFKRAYPVTAIVYKKAYLSYRFPWGFKLVSEQYYKLKELAKRKKQSPEQH